MAPFPIHLAPLGGSRYEIIDFLVWDLLMIAFQLCRNPFLVSDVMIAFKLCTINYLGSQRP